MRLRRLPIMFVAIVLACVTAPLPAFAAYPAQRETSEEGFTFILKRGNQLTIKVGGTRLPVRTHNAIAGQRIDVICQGVDDTGTSVRLDRGRVRWPRRSRTVKLVLEHAMSAQWCLIEEDGTDIAFATFDRAADPRGFERLSGASEDMFYALSKDLPLAAPPTPSLVTMLRTASPGLTFEAMATAADNPVSATPVGVWTDSRRMIRLSELTSAGGWREWVVALKLGVRFRA